MEFHIPLKAFASQCNSNMSLKKRKKKAIMIPPPLYILYTDNQQSSQNCINGTMEENIKTHTYTDIFGKAGIKVTRSVIL